MCLTETTRRKKQGQKFFSSESNQIMRERERERDESYRPDIGGDENDYREWAEPGISNGEDNITWNVRSGEVT